MPYNKFPGNDGLMREFQKTLQYDIKGAFLKYLWESKYKSYLSKFQRQVVIKL